MTFRTLGTLWVTLQFGLLAALAALCGFRLAEQGPGWGAYLLWALGGALGFWTLWANRPGNFNIHPEPRAQGHLVQTGPYRWVRHPMYGSVLLVAAGAVVWLQTWVGGALGLALLGVLVAKAALEERWLVQHHPAYGAYRQRTWRFMPGVY